MVMSHMLYRTDQSSSARRTVSVSTLGRELFLVVSSTGSDQKRRNSSVRISLFGNEERLGRHAWQNGGGFCRRM